MNNQPTQQQTTRAIEYVLKYRATKAAEKPIAVILPKVQVAQS